MTARCQCGGAAPADRECPTCGSLVCLSCLADQQEIAAAAKRAVDDYPGAPAPETTIRVVLAFDADSIVGLVERVIAACVTAADAIPKKGGAT